jgi:peroxiredoxin
VARRVLIAVGIAVALAAADRRGARAEPAVDGPWIGISYGAGGEGLAILEVHDETAASDAGLRSGDEIVEVSGAPVFPGTDLPTLIARTRVGDRLPLAVLRAGVRLDVVLVLGARPSDGELLHRRLVDKAAPALELTRAGERARIDLASLRGRVAVLAFFTTRCDGCGPTLNLIGDRVGRRAPRAQVIAAASDPEDAVAGFLQRSPVTVTVGHDASGDTWRRYTVPTAAPSVIAAVLDHRGIVRYAAVIAAGDDDAIAELALAAERAEKARRRER